jgi:flagellar assembly protein FliH
MTTILRASDARQDSRVVAFHFDDVAVQASRILAEARANAARIVEAANSEADSIRREAAEAGCQAAMLEVEKMIAEKTAPAIDALHQTVADLRQTRQAWLSQWETGAVRLASAIAERIIRRELRDRPDITLALVREALELASGSPGLQVHLHPADYEALGSQVRAMMDAMSAFGDAEVTSDETVSLGGCRVETRFGTIDHQIESQLKRIEEELIG